jgi:hypothetical protein
MLSEDLCGEIAFLLNKNIRRTRDIVNSLPQFPHLEGSIASTPVEIGS